MFDRVRTCDNHCEFCFIYQLPKGMRRSLYLKDDDYRLSFLYGNFTTLTRFTEADLERVITERLSPLNVSIHATDPDVRARMLKNPRGGMSLRWLRALLDHGITVRGQIVLCPGVNDGEMLRPHDGRRARRVPGARIGRGRAARAEQVQQRVGDAAAHTSPRRRRWSTPSRTGRTCSCTALGHRMVFAADEYYLMAGRPFPAAETYEGLRDARGRHRHGAHVRDGVQRRASQTPTGPQAGFFAGVDAAAEPRCRTPACAPALRQRRPRRCGSAPVATRRSASSPASSGRRCSRPLVARPAARRRQRHPGRQRVLRWQHRRHRADGRSRPATGARRRAAGHRYLLPDVCLSEGRFLDGTTIDELPRPVEVVATDGISLRMSHWSPTIMTLPTVVIVGRPNVGKSTLFNRIVGEQVAIVEDRPGVTRDRKETEAEWLGVHFLLVDTGGWLPGGNDLDAKVSRQVEAAVKTADVVLFLVDATTGVTDDDEAIASWLRRIKAPVLLVDQQGRQRTARERPLGVPGAWAPAIRIPSARCTADAPATCSTRSSRCCPPAEDDESEIGVDLEDAARAVEARRHAAATSRHRRPAQRRQEHAVQPPRRRGPIGRARHGRHHPRLHRHACRDRRRPDRVRRHRRHAPSQQRSTIRPSTTRSSAPCGPSTAATSRCS